MKTRELITKLYGSILRGNSEKEKMLWLKIIKKSLKHKKTHAVR